MKPKVGIIMGSDSDLPVMKEASDVLQELGIPYEITIISAHRTPDRAVEYAKTAASRGLKVIIAGAGGSAHLPGVVASMTHLPIIGVPVESKSLHGMDSLLSMVQMPPGVPVATMAINGAKNAGLLAAQIIATSDKRVASKVIKFKTDLRKAVEKKAKALEKLGASEYLNRR